MGTLPYANPTNSAQWAKDLLTQLGDPLSTTNVGYIEAWISLESPSGYGYNPLGTEQGAPGSTNANSAGVQAFTSWAQGLSATVATLYNYAGNSQLLAALKRGNASLAQLGAAQAQGSWKTGAEPGISALGTSQPFSYGGVQGEQKGASGVATSKGAPNPTGWFGQWIEPYTPYPGAVGVVHGVESIPSKIVSGVFGPLVKWIEAGAADVTFVGFGLLLVVIGLVVTFKGEPSVNVASPTGGVAEAGGAAKDAAAAAVA